MAPPRRRANVQGWVLSVGTGVMIVLALIILGAAIAKRVSILSSPQRAVPAES